MVVNYLGKNMDLLTILQQYHQSDGRSDVTDSLDCPDK